MSSIARNPLQPLMMISALGYIVTLAAALIWLQISPLLILILTLGGVFLAICAARPLIAVHTLIAMLQFEGILAESEIGQLAMKALGIVIVLGWLLNLAVDRNRRIKFDGLYVAIGAYLTWCALLFFFAIDPDVVAGRTITYLQLAIAILIFASVIDSPSKLRGIYWSIVGWTTLSALIGSFQYFTGRSPIAVGLVVNRNLLSLYINIAIVCAYILLQGSRRLLARVALGISIPTLILCLALTFSRGGLIVMGISLIVLFVRAVHDRRFVIFSLSAAFIMSLGLTLPSAFWNRAESIVPVIQRQEDTFGLRVTLWKIGMRMIADNPIHGVGPGNFITALPRYAKGKMLRRHLGAHNTYVSVAAEMGLLGLALFLLIHVLAFKRLLKTRASAVRAGNSELASLALAAELSIIVVMLSGISGHYEINKYLWIFFGLSVAISQMRIHNGVQEERVPLMHGQMNSSGSPAALRHHQPDPGYL